MRCPGVVAFVLGLGIGPLSAQSLERADAQFNETLRDSAEISGAVVAGVQIRAKTPDSRGLDPRIPAELLKPESVFCLRLVSANGLYDAENTYVLDPTKPPGRPLIPLAEETSYGSFLRDLKGQEIAAAFTLGECGKEPEGFILSAWEYGGDSDIALLINSFRADTVVARVEDTGKVERCTPVELDLRSAYDVVCRLNFSGLAGEVTVDIVRFVNRQPSQPTSIKILLPDG